MKKGDSVYVVFDDSRILPFEATIISIGSRYITIDNTHRSSARYHKDTLCSADDASGWNARAKLYKSKEAYEQSIIDSARKEELYTKITELKKYIEQSFILQIDLIHQKLNSEIDVEKKYQVGLCEAYLREIASQLARLDTKLTHIDSALTQLDRKLDQMESRLTSKYRR